MKLLGRVIPLNNKYLLRTYYMPATAKHHWASVSSSTWVGIMPLNMNMASWTGQFGSVHLHYRALSPPKVSDYPVIGTTLRRPRILRNGP
jgi:hypothetical protein